MVYQLTLAILKFRDFVIQFFNFIYKLNRLKKYSIDKSVKFHLNTFIYGRGRIVIKANTYFGRETFIVSEPEEAIIKIGKDCKISHGVHIRTSSYSITIDRVTKYSNINIGDNVWIGANVYVSGGVTIGDNVTIGANSVVTKSFPANVVIGGVPAKIIKYLDEV